MKGFDDWLTYCAQEEEAGQYQDLLDDAKDDIVCEILDDSMRMGDVFPELDSFDRITEIYALMAMHARDPLKCGQELLARFFWNDVSYLAEERLEKEGK